MDNKKSNSQELLKLPCLGHHMSAAKDRICLVECRHIAVKIDTTLPWRLSHTKELSLLSVYL